MIHRRSVTAQELCALLWRAKSYAMYLREKEGLQGPMSADLDIFIDRADYYARQLEAKPSNDTDLGMLAPIFDT